jgi:hypothetical protein
VAFIAMIHDVFVSGLSHFFNHLLFTSNFLCAVFQIH